MIVVLVAQLATATAGELSFVYQYEAGTSVTEVEPALDEMTVGILETGSDVVYVLRTDIWTSVAVQPCPGLSGLAAYEGGYAVGCGDGGVAFIDVEEGWPLYPSEGFLVVPVSESPILGLGHAQGTILVATEDPKNPDANPSVFAINVDDKVVIPKPWPVMLTAPGFADAAGTLASVIVAHGSDRLSQVDTVAGTVAPNQIVVAGADCDDVDATDTVVLLACDFAVLRYTPGTSTDLVPVANIAGGYTDAQAVWIDPALEDEPEGIVWVADNEEGIFLFGLDNGSGAIDDDMRTSLAGSFSASEMGGVHGYGLLGTTDGYVNVYTNKPWITASVNPELAVDGDVVDFTFSSSLPGLYRVVLGDTEVASGSIGLKEEITVPIKVDEGMAEGGNVIVVFVTEDAGGLPTEGRGGAILTVDNPPTPVVLDEGDLGWGDGKLFLTFDGIPDEDLASYQIYVSKTEFDADDYPKGGGPLLEGLDPAPVTALPGETVSVTLEPLTNGVLYYVAVRAIDAGGTEGPMSNVVSETPQETFLASELAGESGGFDCGCGRGGAATSLGALGLAGVLALGRRRATGAAAMLFALAFGADARAQESTTTDEDPKIQWQHAGLELRVGPLWFEDVGGGNNPIETVYDDTGNNVIMLEGGPSLLDILQLEFGVGRYHRKGNQAAATGESSSDESVITVYPLTVGGKLRLDVLKEQWIVPTAAVGLDYWLWSEKADYDSTSYQWATSSSGGKSGWHMALGGQILLDAFEPKRASQLTARTGIDDSYLVAEWRRREVGVGQGGFIFTGSEVTVGLRIGY